MASPYVSYIIAHNEDKEARKVHRQGIRDFGNPFTLPDQEFEHLFRVTKAMALYICEQVRVQLESSHGSSLPIHVKVLISIRFMADGGYQRPTGQDHSLCIAQTTVSKYLSKFCRAMVAIMGQWIKFPGDAASRAQISQGFQRKFGVPNLLGTIDCTHVKIFPPPLPHGTQYINRKGVHTINVQLVADVDCRILGVLARFPGSVHDQFIFNNSVVKDEMKRLYEGGIGEYILLGDSGYALEPWLMTPVVDAPQNSPEAIYTEWHCLVRNTIERTNGYIKGTFRCLGIDRVLHYSPTKASEIIYTCCILYNMRKHFGMETYPDTGNYEDQEITSPPPLTNPHQRQLLRVAQEKRANFINTYFN